MLRKSGTPASDLAPGKPEPGTPKGCGSVRGLFDVASATFRRCNLAYADFSGTKLTGCELSECRLVHSLWHDADLGEADLQGSSFENIEGRGLILSGADLRGATINNLDPRDVDLNGVRMNLDQGIVILRTLGIEMD